MEPYPVHATAMELENRGFSYDLVSDRLLADARCEKRWIVFGDDWYSAVVVPKCRMIPATTVKKLVELARAGATVIFLGSLPTDVPGLGDLEKRRGELKESLNEINPKPKGFPPELEFRWAKVGTGQIMVGESVSVILFIGRAGFVERMAEYG